jgi:hypothetical protein
MKDDFAAIQDKTQMAKNCIAYIKEDQLRGMLRIYALQRRKINTARACERLQHLSVIRQTLPVLENLIEAAGNFEVALDLIQKAQDLIQNNLKGVTVCESFNAKLEQLKFKCT